MGFERVDFVTEPGEFAVRGGIIDVFSFAYQHPYRIEFFDDTLSSVYPVFMLKIKVLYLHMIPLKFYLIPPIWKLQIIEKPFWNFFPQTAVFS